LLVGAPAAHASVVYTFHEPLATDPTPPFLDVPGASNTVTLVPGQSDVVWTAMTLDAPALTTSAQGWIGNTLALVCLKSTGGTDGGPEGGAYATAGNLWSGNHNAVAGPQWVLTNTTLVPVTYTCKATIRFYSTQTFPGVDVTVSTADGSPVRLNVRSDSDPQPYSNAARWTLPKITPARQIQPGTTGVTLGYAYQLPIGATNVALREFANVTQCQVTADPSTCGSSAAHYADLSYLLSVQPQDPVTGAACGSPWTSATSTTRLMHTTRHWTAFSALNRNVATSPPPAGCRQLYVTMRVTVGATGDPVIVENGTSGTGSFRIVGDNGQSVPLAMSHGLAFVF
jgi:hypothetical protein